MQKAVKWIGQQRGGYGGFGSTQSTILALKALIAYTKANKKTPEAGRTETVRRRQGSRRSCAFAAGATEALTLDRAGRRRGPEARREQGAHRDHAARTPSRTR